MWIGLALLATVTLISAFATNDLGRTIERLEYLEDQHLATETPATQREYEVLRATANGEVRRQHQLDIYGTLSCLVIIAIGFVRSRRETAARVRSEREARRASQFLDSIIANMPHHIVIRDARTMRYLRLNRAAEQFLGRADLVGKTAHDVFDPDVAARLELEDRKVIETNQLVDLPDQLAATPLGPRWVACKKIPIVGDDGVPWCVVSISEDVHDRHLELASSQSQLLQAQKMDAVGRLAGGVAHDFNNLLTVILGHTEMMLETHTDEELRGDIGEIKEAAERAAALTKQLLAFSRRQVLAPKVVLLDDVIGGMQKLLRRVIGEDVELRTIAAAKRGRVRVDPNQIEQVLMNLAVNARDAMPRGGALELETSCVALGASSLQLPPGDYAVISVRDTGTGMDDATRARIFEPFFTTKEPGKGTGLGLSTVFGIVRQSGGAIDVSSEVGTGTTFSIYFPTVSQRVTTASPPLAKPATRGTEVVLLVEDEAGVRSLMSNALGRSGYRVFEASNGEEALRVMADHAGEIDLLLSDVVMPKMSGRELFAKVSALRPDMKVLFMSGYTDDTIIHHGIDRDFAFIHKPVTPDVLMRKIRTVLEAGR